MEVLSLTACTASAFSVPDSFKWLHNSFNEEQMAHVNRPYSILWMGLGMRNCKNCWRKDPRSWLAAVAHTGSLWLDDWRSIWPLPKKGWTVAVSVYVCCQSSRLMLKPSWEMLLLHFHSPGSEVCHLEKKRPLCIFTATDSVHWNNQKEEVFMLSLPDHMHEKG